MKKAYVRFYEELNDFLPDEKRKVRFLYEFTGTPSIKDVIEAIGVPHGEVDMILVNGLSVDFNYKVDDNNDISVYPVFESFDISGIQHLRPSPLRNPAFILDVHLGSLAKYMRMAGFDVLYKNNYTIEEIIKISTGERRAILTKDRNILKRNEVTHGYWVRKEGTEEQLSEIIKRFHLEKNIEPFTRCMECNALLKDISKEEILNELPPKIRERQKEFKKCPGCGKTYWKGSHYEKMQSFIDELQKSL